MFSSFIDDFINLIGNIDVDTHMQENILVRCLKYVLELYIVGVPTQSTPCNVYIYTT